MTIRWRPDTCGCVIDIEHGSNNFVDWVQKCQGHKDFDGQKLVDNCIIQCHKFQLKQDATKEDRQKNVLEKIAERKRIAEMGSVIKNNNVKRKSII